MKLAWKELAHQKKKYLLIDSIIILMMFMVLFLSGLVNGLGRSIISSIDQIDASYYLVSDSSENLISVSSLPQDTLQQLQEMTDANVTPLNIQRTYLSKLDSDDKIDIHYLAIEPGSYLEPDVYEGTSLVDATCENPIILDDNYEEEGIALGDMVKDSTTGMEFQVVGFSKDQMYSHTSAGFITMDSYTKLRTEINPNYEPVIQSIVIQGDDIENIDIPGTMVAHKTDIINQLPGYTAEKSTITMVIWMLVIISAAVIGVFYYILTIQKEKQFGIMKAMGVTMHDIGKLICSQVLIVVCFGAFIANLLAFGMASFLPKSMPFYLTANSAFVVTFAFIAISLISSLLSVRKVAQVDPMNSIGGAE